MKRTSKKVTTKTTPQRAVKKVLVKEEDDVKYYTEEIIESTIGEDYVYDEGKFLFENSKIMLTYGSTKLPTHIDKKDYIEWINKVFPNVKVIFCRLAHESADDLNQYLHTHVVIQWESAVKTTSCRKFDYIMPDGTIRHPNIKRIKTMVHFKNAQKYLGKEDVENTDLVLINVSWQEKLAECKTEADVIAICQKMSDVNGALRAFQCIQQPVKIELDLKKLSRWQWVLLNRMDIASNGKQAEAIFKNVDTKDEWDSDASFEIEGDERVGRNLIVIYNPLGRSGKTRFIKLLIQSDPARFLPMQGIAQPRDFATQLMSGFKSGWNGDTLLINLTRQAADHKIYSSIEMGVDGLVSEQKYAGMFKEWNAKNVVIFTNFMPNIDAVTPDRWEIYKVNKLNSDLRRMETDLCRMIYIDESNGRKREE